MITAMAATEPGDTRQNMQQVVSKMSGVGAFRSKNPLSALRSPLSSLSGRLLTESNFLRNVASRRVRQRNINSETANKAKS